MLDAECNHQLRREEFSKWKRKTPLLGACFHVCQVIMFRAVTEENRGFSIKFAARTVQTWANSCPCFPFYLVHHPSSAFIDFFLDPPREQDTAFNYPVWHSKLRISLHPATDEENGASYCFPLPPYPPVFSSHSFLHIIVFVFVHPLLVHILDGRSRQFLTISRDHILLGGAVYFAKSYSTFLSRSTFLIGCQCFSVGCGQ